MPALGGRMERLVTEYRKDHTHPINHALHLFVGWPMVGAALFLAWFKPLWALALFLGGYAFMFSGHFLFEKNLPTILKKPSTPFIMAWAVLRDLGRMLLGRGAAESSWVRPTGSHPGETGHSPSSPLTPR